MSHDTGSASYIDRLEAGWQGDVWCRLTKRLVHMCRVAAVTERCDWPKEAGSRSKAVRCMADCTQLCPGAAQQPGSPSSSSSTAVVDVELLARENPGLVLAQESHHSCSADAQHIAEVLPRPLLFRMPSTIS